MVHFNARTKSALLACTMIVSANSSCIELSNPVPTIVSSVTANKAALLSTVVVILLALKVRLDTKPRGVYSYDNVQDDILDLLSSWNIFSAASRATIFNFIDKYFVGSKFKLDEITIRTKEEDGSVMTTKRNKVSQKPSGLMGLFDAYVLQQLEADNKILPALAAMYLVITNPELSWTKDLKGILKEDFVKLV